MPLPEDDWRERALCQGQAPVDGRARGAKHPWFPGNKLLEIAETKKRCEPCQVKDECLEYAIELKIEHGIWGGLTERERRKVRRKRRLDAQREAS